MIDNMNNVFSGMALRPYRK